MLSMWTNRPPFVIEGGKQEVEMGVLRAWPKHKNNKCQHDEWSLHAVYDRAGAICEARSGKGHRLVIRECGYVLSKEAQASIDKG